MLLIPSTIFRSLGAGAIIVVVVSVLVTLTLLPAILGLLGDRVNSLRVPIIGRSLDHVDNEHLGGFWDRITRTVMRFPVISLVAAIAVLVALAVPYFDIKTGSEGVSTLPQNTRAYAAFKLLQDDFNFGRVAPTQIVVHGGDVTSPEVQGALDRLKTTLAADPLFGPPSFESSSDKSTGVLSVSINADPRSDPAVSAVRDLRKKAIPTAFKGVGADVFTTGATARNIDYYDTTTHYTPIVFAFVLGLSFVLLTIVFRSLVVPLKAILMNLLSVGASYGALVLVFQKGFLHSILGFQQVDVIEAWVPLWTFSILFGLSMDYHVFLLSRIRERFNATGDNSETVAFGVRSTAGIITGAALIMASVFGGVASGQPRHVPADGLRPRRRRHPRRHDRAVRPRPGGDAAARQRQLVPAARAALAAQKEAAPSPPVPPAGEAPKFWVLVDSGRFGLTKAVFGVIQAWGNQGPASHAIGEVQTKPPPPPPAPTALYPFRPDWLTLRILIPRDGGEGPQTRAPAKKGPPETPAQPARAPPRGDPDLIAKHGFVVLLCVLGVLLLPVLVSGYGQRSSSGSTAALVPFWRPPRPFD